MFYPTIYCRFCNSYDKCFKEVLTDSNRITYDYRATSNLSCKAVIGEQNLSPSNFKLSYPFIENLNDEGVKAKINNALIDVELSLLRKQVLLPEEINFKEILSFYDVTLNDKCILSILFGIYTFTGGAHGYTYYESLTLNLDTGNIYSFSDLFNPKVYYIGFLNEFIKKYIADNQIPVIEDFTGIKDNQQFYLTPDSLVLYYQVYEYTPYYYGLFKIPIPYTEIENLLGPLSPIQRFL